MNAPLLTDYQATWIIRVAVFILFFALGVFTLCVVFANELPDVFQEWLSALAGTALGAVLAARIGLWLFQYQTEKIRRDRQKELLQALITELQATRDRLKTTPAIEVRNPNPTRAGEEEEEEEQVVKLTLAQLEPTACNEAIRSAILGHVSTRNLTYLARLMRDYTRTAELFAESQWRPQVYVSDFRQRHYDLAKETKRMQHFVTHFCDVVLDDLEAQGIELPPDERYFSDPSREAPDDAFRYDE